MILECAGPHQLHCFIRCWFLNYSCFSCFYAGLVHRNTVLPLSEFHELKQLYPENHATYKNVNLYCYVDDDLHIPIIPILHLKCSLRYPQWKTENYKVYCSFIEWVTHSSFQRHLSVLKAAPVAPVAPVTNIRHGAAWSCSSLTVQNHAECCFREGLEARTSASSNPRPHQQGAIEAWHIWSQPLPMNREAGLLPPVYNGLINKLS